MNMVRVAKVLGKYFSKNIQLYLQCFLMVSASKTGHQSKRAHNIYIQFAKPCWKDAHHLHRHPPYNAEGGHVLTSGCHPTPSTF